jgi:hypothetical protein
MAAASCGTIVSRETGRQNRAVLELQHQGQITSLPVHIWDRVPTEEPGPGQEAEGLGQAPRQDG